MNKNPTLKSPLQKEPKANFMHSWKKNSDSSKNSKSGKFTDSSCSMVEDAITPTSQFSEDFIKADSFDKFKIQSGLSSKFSAKSNGKCVLVESGELSNRNSEKKNE